jgi:hypothetical protein
MSTKGEFEPAYSPLSGPRKPFLGPLRAAEGRSRAPASMSCCNIAELLN